MRSIKINAILKMLLNIFNIFVPLAVGPYISSFFDKDLYNEFYAAQALVSVLLPFAGFGIYSYGMRYVSRVREDPKQASKLFTTLFSISCVTNISILIIFVVYSFLMEQGSLDIYLAYSIYLFAGVFITEWMNEAYERYGFIMLKTIIVRLCYIVAIFTLVKKPDDVFLYTMIASLAELLNNISSFIFVKKRVKFNFEGINWAYIKPIIKALFFLVLISNAHMLFVQLDKMFLRTFGRNEMTDYTMPQTLVDTLVNVVNGLVLVTIPRLSYYFCQKDEKNYLNLYKKASQTYFMLIYPVAVGIAVTSNLIMDLYGHGRFPGTIPVLALFGLRMFEISASTVMTNQVIYIYGREKVITYFLIAGGVINLILNSALVLLDWLTPFALVLTTILAEIPVVLLEWRFVKRLNPQIKLFQKCTVKYFVLSVCFFPISYAVSLLQLGVIKGGFLTIGACVVFYGGALLITKDEMAMEYVNGVMGKLRLRKAK